MKTLKINNGFTLIELMIVVVIIGILASIAIPQIAKLGEEKQPDLEDSSGITLAPETVINNTAKLPWHEVKGESAEVNKIQTEIKLTAGHQVVGLNVRSWYDADLTSIISFNYKGEPESNVLLIFPFPDGALQAREVLLEMSDKDNNWQEPANVNYSHAGVYWSGTVKEHDFKVRIKFRLLGKEQFMYRLPGKGRTEKVMITVSLKNASPDLVPANSLQPNIVENDIFIWEFNNLVTHNRTLLINLPNVDTPLGKVILLGKLAGVAVFLFGLGFLYLCEGKKPGGLDNFRWGDFLLLAITYAMFFLAFEVLMFRYKTPVTITIAMSAAASLPLLLVYLLHHFNPDFIDMKFALTRIIPLAVFTIALVVNGVYGGEIREYIFLAAAFLVLAYVNLSWRQWSDGRRQYKQHLRVQRKLDDIKQRFDKANKNSEKIALAVNSPKLECLMLTRRELVSHNEQFAELCTQIEKNTEQLNVLKTKEISLSLQKEVDSLCDSCDEYMRKVTEIADNQVKYSEEILAKLNEEEQKNADKRLSDWKITNVKLEKLIQGLLTAEVKKTDIEEQLRLTDGKSVLVDQNGANTSLSQLESLVAECNNFKQVLWELKESANEGFSVQSHDYVEAQNKYEQKLRTIDFEINTSINKVNRLIGLFQSQLNHLESLNQDQSGVVKTKHYHCPACGERSTLNARYCGLCGEDMPLALKCMHCKTDNFFLRHLCIDDPKNTILHCCRCGETIQSIKSQSATKKMANKD